MKGKKKITQLRGKSGRKEEGIYFKSRQRTVMRKNEHSGTGSKIMSKKARQGRRDMCGGGRQSGKQDKAEEMQFRMEKDNKEQTLEKEDRNAREIRQKCYS